MIFCFVNPDCNVFFDLKIWLADTITLTSARGYTCTVYLLSFMPKRKISKRAPLGKRRGGRGGGVARTQRPPYGTPLLYLSNAYVSFVLATLIRTFIRKNLSDCLSYFPLVLEQKWLVNISIFFTYWFGNNIT